MGVVDNVKFSHTRFDTTCVRCLDHVNLRIFIGMDALIGSDHLVGGTS